MTEDTRTTTEPRMMLPAPVAHSLDDVCHGGECATCTQNIQIATLAELRELNALLRPFAQMAQTRMGLLRGFTRGT